MQVDFVLPGGKLYVPDAEKIIPKIDSLVESCRQGRVFLVSSTDAHKLADQEFRDWPPHCLKGTPGAELIPEACAPNRFIIPNEPGVSLPAELSSYNQLVIEKNSLDIFDNPNTDAVLASLNPNAEFAVFGVATEYCVALTIEGLLRRGKRVAIVTDAVQPMDAAKGGALLDDFRSRGVRLLNAEQALSLLPSAA